jgi:uncharacterized protein with GYD domain
LGEDAKQRLEKAKALIAKRGAKLHSAYITLGRYDLVSVIEAPNDKAIAKLSSELFDALGLKAETLPAIPLEEYLRS